VIRTCAERLFAFIALCRVKRKRSVFLSSAIDCLREVKKNPRKIPGHLYHFTAHLFTATAGSLKIGDAAPDAELLDPGDGSTVRLRDRFRNRPLVLVFGSFT